MSTDRTWMKIHSGLNEPKHRAAIGVRIWLFMDIIDHADWETGIARDWRDDEAAERLDMPIKTLRTQRKKLKEAGYIQCFKGDQCQHIMVLRWRNPRFVSAPQINVPEEDYEDWGCPKVATPSSRKLRTPSSRKVATPILESHESQNISEEKDTAQPAAPTPTQLRKHPAIQAFRDKAHLYPAETWLQRVIDAVGETPERVEAWGKLVDSWVGMGWNKRNVSGMLDAFKAGGIETTRKSNGNHASHADDMGSPETMAYAAMVKERRAKGAAF